MCLIIKHFALFFKIPRQNNIKYVSEGRLIEKQIRIEAFFL